MFSVEYDSIKDRLLDEDGNQISLEDYLTAISTLGEFNNTMDKPVLEFISVLLDITIIKPVIEAFLGYDMITKENLSDLDRVFKIVGALIDIVTLFVGIKGSGILKIISKENLQYTGKTMVVDMISNGVTYGVQKSGKELGLPAYITLIISLVTGMT